MLKDLVPWSILLLRPGASLVLFGADAREAVGDIEVELVGALDDLPALLCRHSVGNLHTVLLIVHEKHLDILWGVHRELVEAIGDVEMLLMHNQKYCVEIA